MYWRVPNNRSLSLMALTMSPLPSKMEATMVSTTPNFLTLAGNDNHIGSTNLTVAMSIGSSVPTGIVLLEKLVDANSTILKLVQSKKFSVD